MRKEEIQRNLIGVRVFKQLGPDDWSH